MLGWGLGDGIFSLHEMYSPVCLCWNSFALINLRGVFTNNSIICFIAMQTNKERISNIFLRQNYFRHAHGDIQ